MLIISAGQTSLIQIFTFAEENMVFITVLARLPIPSVSSEKYFHAVARGQAAPGTVYGGAGRQKPCLILFTTRVVEYKKRSSHC